MTKAPETIWMFAGGLKKYQPGGNGEWEMVKDPTDTSREAVEQVIDLLLQTDKTKHGYYGYVAFNRDGRSAAATLLALLARTESAQALVAEFEAAITRREDMHECAMQERDDATLYADEQKARAKAAEAERDEARRRRDEWRKKAEGFDALQSAVRSGIDEAGDRNLSLVFLRGALVVSEKERDAAISRAEKAEAACAEWQSIETAPKDGTEFLGFVGVSYKGGVVLLHWDKIDGFIDWDEDFWEPTHWMPLPPPPETP